MITRQSNPVRVRVADPDLSARLEAAIQAALARAAAARPAPLPLQFIRVTARNARRLPRIIARREAASPARIALICTPAEAALPRVTRALFAALESRRGTSRPLLLAPSRAAALDTAAAW